MNQRSTRNRGSAAPGAGAQRAAALFCLTLVSVALIGIAPARAAAGEAVGAAAEESATPRVITFDEAVRIALERNISVLRSANATDLNRLSVSDAKGQFLPDLTLDVTGAETHSWSWAGGESGDRSSTTGQIGVGLSSSLVLFDGFRNISGLRQARYEEAAGLLDHQRARQTVVFEVITGYLAMIEATEQVRIREESLRAQEEQEELVRALVEEGERPISDLYQQQSAVASARLALVEARRSLDLSRVDLVQTLQLDPTQTVVFEPPSAAELEADTTGQAFAPLLETAFANRPDLRAIAHRLDASRQRERAAGAARWPTLALGAGYGSSYFSDADGDLGDQLDDNQWGSASLSLSLSYPIFDGFVTGNAIRRAQVQTENTDLELQDLRQQVALQVRRALLDRNAAREGLQAAEARVAAARVAHSYTNERYLAGASTLYEVTLSRADLVAAESEEVNARYNLLWQNRLIDYYVGRLDPARGLVD